MAGAVGPLSPWGAGRVKEDRAGLPPSDRGPQDPPRARQPCLGRSPVATQGCFPLGILLSLETKNQSSVGKETMSRVF